MGLITHRVKQSDLKVGDHIYTWSKLFTFSHHGIYVGDGQVVHFTLGQESCSPRNCTSTSSLSIVQTSGVIGFCVDCSFSGQTSGVIESCLNCFLQNGSLHRFEYGVNWLSFTAKIRGGTCTTAKSDPCEIVIHRAMYLLRNGFKKYHLFENNCEDFAVYCKTGFLRGSMQVSSVEAVGVATVVSSVS